MFKPLAFLDTETTGLDPTLHEVIEVAVIRVQPNGDEERYHTLIKPENLGVAQARALEVNGYAENPSLWDDAPKLSAVAEELAAFLDGCILVGHNASYDEAMLKGVFKRHGFEFKIPHRKIDTITLCYEHLTPLGATNMGMDATRKFLGWPTEGRHRAMADVEDARRLYLLLNQAGWWTYLKIRAKRFLCRFR